MGDKSAIEWTDASWNPLVGCSRVSEGCRNCYAERVAARFSGPGQPYEGLARWKSRVSGLKYTNRGSAGDADPGWTGEVRLVEKHLTDPFRWRKPRRIFVNSMSDLFHERVPDEWIDRIFAVMALAPKHTFQVLTKRPERMLAQLRRARMYDGVLRAAEDFRRAFPRTRLAPVSDPTLHGLPNVWLGVSVEDQATAEARIPLLLSTPAAVRFVSYEPALGPVDFRRIRSCSDERAAKLGVSSHHSALFDHGGYTQKLDQIIVGGESGPGARPCDVAWIRATLDQCRAAGVACFVKQLGAHVMDRDDAGVEGEEPRDWPSGTETKDWTEDPARRSQGAPMRVYLRDRKGGDPAEWPEDLRVREFPQVRE